MKDSLVLFAPCGDQTSCEACYKKFYVIGFCGNSVAKKCRTCSQKVKSYVKKVFNWYLCPNIYNFKRGKYNCLWFNTEINSSNKKLNILFISVI